MVQITTYEITGQQGDNINDRLCISNYGARLVSWHTQVDDEIRNIVLGYSNLEDYFTDESYLGAIVGPYANRIGNSRCKIDGKEINLAANEGHNLLHSGANAFANQFWQCIEHTQNSVTLICTLTNGFNGFPGDINIEVIYEISAESELTISIKVNSEQLTIAGPTAHPYFNLNKEQSTTLHNLQIFSEHYTPVNNQCIPTGEITVVDDTQYDFRTAREVSSKNNTQQLDHNFLLSLTDSTTELTSFPHASIESSDKKLTLHASSNYPAVQVYTGLHLTAPFKPNQGICLEPQFCPDSPNQANFPFHFTSPQQPLATVICYKLSK
ncbi:aldose epimerase family protein [Pseudocolwellia sp. HL-MZ7]|uniref:aldose epimerase family protein n=1 Tax=Pseudocolwellia sp. HL-MZ7 TaxID=3400627 RepID=UPI003CE77632